MPPQTQQTESPAYQWGKMGSGRRWHKIAADLDRAWASCKLSPNERRLLQYIRETTWGDAAISGVEPGPCQPPISALADAWDVHRCKLSTALGDLVRDRLVVRVGPGLAVNKDVLSWGEGRIDPAAIRYAIAGPEGVTEKVTRRAAPVTEKVTPEAADRYQEGNTPCYLEGNASVTEKVTPEAAPYRNAGASEDLRFKKDNQERGREGDSPRTITEPIEASPLPPNTSPASPPSPAAEDLDRKLARWVYEKVLATTGDKAEAREFGLAVAAWRAVDVPRHHVASVVLEFFSWKAKEVPPEKHLGYVRAIFRNRKPGEDIPPCPPEWKPEPPKPVYFTLSPEEYAATKKLYSGPPIPTNKAERDRLYLDLKRSGRLKPYTGVAS